MGRQRLMTPLELLGLFHQLNKDSAATGGVVVPLTPEGFDEQFYAEQIWNHYDACGRTIGYRTANRLAREMGALIANGVRAFTIVREFIATQEAVGFGRTAKEAENSVDWKNVEDDFEPLSARYYEGDVRDDMPDEPDLEEDY